MEYSSASNTVRLARAIDPDARGSPSDEGQVSVRFVLGGFLVLHGLVHLLYFGQSSRAFELQPGMVWPDGSWALSRLLGNEAVRAVGSVACIVAAVGFVAAGTALLLAQGWWRPVAVGAAGFSSVMLLLLWDGRMQKLTDQGAIAVLINAAILIAVLVAHWPDFDF